MRKKRVTGVLPGINMGTGRLPGLQRVVAVAPSSPSMAIYGADIGPEMTVSIAGRRVVTAGSIPSIYNSARVSAPLPAVGKFAWRHVVSRQPTSSALVFGVGTSALSLTTYVGKTSSGWGFLSDGASAYYKITNDVTTTFMSAFGLGDTVEVAIDVSAGLLWFGMNGYWPVGDPASGGSAAFTGLTGTLYPMVSMQANQAVYLDPNITPPLGFSALP